MPLQDSRRLSGPQETKSLVSFLPKPKIRPIFNSRGLRQDGRRKDEVRSMYYKTGSVCQANGSSYIETDGIKLICAVYGPRDHPKRHDFSSTGTLTCEFNFLPFSQQKRVNPQDSLSKEYSTYIIQALTCAVCLESYPKSQIDIYITVLEDDGNILSHALVAASIALADAGIEMLDLVTSSTLSYTTDAEFIIDPAGNEIDQCVGELTLAYLPSLNQISFLNKRGTESLDKSIQNINTCIEACLRVHTAMKEFLVNLYVVTET